MTCKPRSRWTSSEDNLLRSAVAKQGPADIDWLLVANHLPNRTNKDCRKRWVYYLSSAPKKGRWSEDEDARLLAGVSQHGYRWALVSQVVGSRQPDQCSRRWHETANPNITHERWTLLEDETLRNAVAMHGRKWTEIVERYFFNRTPLAAKNRYIQRFGDESSSSTSALIAAGPSSMESIAGTSYTPTPQAPASSYPTPGTIYQQRFAAGPSTHVVFI